MYSNMKPLFLGILFGGAFVMVHAQSPMQPSGFIVNIAGYGNVDIGQVPSPALVHVLQGGQIAGLPAGALENTVRGYLNGMYAAAVRALQNNPLPQDRVFLPPLAMFSREVVMTFLTPSAIPYLTPQQLAVINQYYANQVAPFLNAADMVLICGIAPGHQIASIHSTVTNETKNNIGVQRVLNVDIDKINEMYEELLLQLARYFPADKELGTLAIFLGQYDYNNDIRKKFIQRGYESGFKKVEIIDWFTSLFYDGLVQADYIPEEDDIIWIYDYSNTFIWKKFSTHSELIHCIGGSFFDGAKLANLEALFGKEPDLVLFGDPPNGYVRDLFSRYDNVEVLNKFKFAPGALVKAHVMAGNADYGSYEAKNVLGRKIKIKVGKKTALKLPSYQTLPYEKVFKVKKDVDEMELCIIDGEAKCQTRETIDLPASEICILTVKIDENGIYEISMAKQTFIIITINTVELFNVASQKSFTFPFMAAGNTFPFTSAEALKKLFKKCSKLLAESNDEIFLAVPSNMSEEQKYEYLEIAKSAGLTKASVIDEQIAALLKYHSVEEVNCRDEKSP